jgi:hypothetical protein
MFKKFIYLKNVQHLLPAAPLLYTNKLYMRNVKKVEAFSRLVGFCTGYGGKYNPGQPNLRVDALVAYIENAKQAIERVTIAKSLHDAAVNSRKDEFKLLGKLAPNILRAMKNSDASKETLKDARLFVRQIAGYSPKDREPITSAEAGVPIAIGLKARRSSLQMAYASKVDWFDKLVKALESQPLYSVGVDALTKPSLQAKTLQLKDLNEKVITSYVAWSNARMHRDKILFENADSLYNVMTKVKGEVCMIFGSNSPEYAQVKSLSFTKPNT